MYIYIVDIYIVDIYIMYIYICRRDLRRHFGVVREVWDDDESPLQQPQVFTPLDPTRWRGTHNFILYLYQTFFLNVR